MKKRAESPRQKTSRLLEITHNKSDSSGKTVDYLLMTLIALSVLSVILESIESLHEDYADWFFAFEVFSISIFTVEYLLRVWSCIELNSINSKQPIRGRLRYMLSPLALVDLISILPFFLGLFISVDLRFLRVIRLLRVLKMSRYSATISVLLDVLQEEKSTFFAAMFILFLMLILASSGMYILERDLQPEAFGSIPSAMWWAMATLTTIGYGDVVPITAAGKFFASFIGLIGIGMIALPAGILATGFADHLHRRRSKYTTVVSDALEDGIISDDDRWELEELRKELNLTKEEASLLFDTMARKGLHLHHKCPHCDKPLNQNERTKSS